MTLACKPQHRCPHRFVARGYRRHTALLSSLAALVAMIPCCAWSACSVSTPGLDFGNYDPLSGQNTDSAGTIAVNCSLDSPYSLALSTGAGTYANRKMTAGTQPLTYNLYTGPARIFVWGDGTGSTATVSGVGSGITTNVTVYGRIPALQNVRVGHYVDNIVVTINF